ncbi:hypothetical protein APR41_06155 [Salegentibacter salinarum]|uniref:Uncharacterized protein n=1 Tax=Salegentibacter salinarum TaxID=447422 RepID=A0A2N0TQK9_9FLAO|nr:hypothetical protein APR41_06155 [Salegentibacter salinarum]
MVKFLSSNDLEKKIRRQKQMSANLSLGDPMVKEIIKRYLCVLTLISDYNQEAYHAEIVIFCLATYRCGIEPID